MPTLNIGGKKVTVGDEFLSLPPEQQNAAVEEIAASLGEAAKPQRGAVDKLLGIGGERYQTWPERAVRGIASSVGSAVTLPGQVMNEAQQRPPSQISDSDVSALSVPRALDFAAIASPINPMVRSGDMAIPGAKMAPTFPGKVAPPSTQEIKDAASAGYKAAGDIPLVVRPEAVQNMARGAQADLEQKGFREQFAPNTFSILSDLQKPPAGGFATGQDLETVRQSLNLARRSVDPRESAAAKRVLEQLEGWRGAMPEADVLAGTAPASSAAYNKASGNYAAAMRSNKVTGELDNAYTGMLDRGELNAATANSGANVDNAIRQQAKILLKNRKDLSGFSKDEIAALETVAKGTATSNALRRIGNLLGGGGGMGAAVSGAVAGGGAAAATGNPLMLGVGIAAPAVGSMAKAGSAALTKRQARLLDEMIRKRSPLYQDMLNTAPKNTLSDLRRSGALRALMLEQQ